jgi:hypothetical protein
VGLWDCGIVGLWYVSTVVVWCGDIGGIVEGWGLVTGWRKRLRETSREMEWLCEMEDAVYRTC